MSRYIRVFLPCFLAVKKMKLSREENWINYPRALKKSGITAGRVYPIHFLNKYFTNKSFIAEDFEANK